MNKHTFGSVSPQPLGMPFDEVVARVRAAKETQPASGLVRAMTCICPAHDDSRPSLLVSETDDNRVLMHCRAGCTFDEVRLNLGLEPIDLIPEHLRHARHDGNRRAHAGPRFSAWQVLQAIALDVIIVVIAASQIRREGWLDDVDFDALAHAEARIQHTIQAGGLSR